MVVGIRIPQLHHRQGHLGELDLESQDRGARLLGAGGVIAQEAQHLGDVGGEGIAHALGGGLVAEIERALGQGQARLPEIQGDLGLVLLVLGGEDAEERPGAFRVQVGGGVEQGLRGLGLVELGQDRAEAGRQFSGAMLEPQGRAPKIGEATLITVGILLRQQVGVDREQVLLDKVILPSEGIIDRPVGGDGMRLVPAAVRVQPKILRRGHRGVAVRLHQIGLHQGGGQQQG